LSSQKGVGNGYYYHGIRYDAPYLYKTKDSGLEYEIYNYHKSCDNSVKHIFYLSFRLDYSVLGRVSSVSCMTTRASRCFISAEGSITAYLVRPFSSLCISLTKPM